MHPAPHVWRGNPDGGLSLRPPRWPLPAGGDNDQRTTVGAGIYTPLTCLTSRPPSTHSPHTAKSPRSPSAFSTDPSPTISSLNHAPLLSHTSGTRRRRWRRSPEATRRVQNPISVSRGTLRQVQSPCGGRARGPAEGFRWCRKPASAGEARSDRAMTLSGASSTADEPLALGAHRQRRGLHSQKGGLDRT